MLRQPEWSALALMEQPDVVERVHRAFVAAGADVLTTNSYALVPFHIGADRFWRDGTALADRAGCLARQAVANVTDRVVWVAGSLPPVFGSYEPDKFDPERAPAHLAVLVTGLRPHVDLWLGETLSLIAEAEAVCAAVAGTGKPVWISFTLDDVAPADAPRLRSGESVVDAARWAVTAPITALLFNCSQPETMVGAIRVARQELASGRPEIRLGAYANAFAPVEREGAANESLSTLRGDLGPARYTATAATWIAEGASVLGGCCGIGFDHIAALRRRFAASDARADWA